MLSCTPENILVNIFEYLDYRDLLSLSKCCRRLSQISRYDDLWARQCVKHWNLPAYTDECSCWFDSFAVMYTRWGEYIDCYRDIRIAWDQILSITAHTAPRVYQSLLPGLSDEQLRMVESHLQMSLPLDVKCSYRICNGQRTCSGSKGLLGYYDVDIPGDFLFPLLGTYHGSMVESVDFNCIPIAGVTNHTKPVLLCLQDCPEQFLRAGTVFNLGGVDEVEDAEDSDDYECQIKINIFVIGKDFKEFIVNLAQKLTVFPVIDSAVLKYEPNSFSRTGHITVSCSTCFARELSFLTGDAPPIGDEEAQHDMSRFCYRYRITMKMDDDAPYSESCQLEDRHWVITDDRGNVERVDGQGVVGTYPIMRPGAQYTWISSTSFSTPYGSMGGHFVMRNLRSGFRVEVECAPFHLRAPTPQTFDKRRLEWLPESMSCGDMSTVDAACTSGDGRAESTTNQR